MRTKAVVSEAALPIRVLFVCHEGARYGAQRSLLTLLAALSPERIKAFVSVAKDGPLLEDLAALPHVTVLRHQRVAWVKHSERRGWQRLGDLLGLLASCVTRPLKLARHIDRLEIDLVHTNSLASLEGALAAWWTGRPHVWHIREMLVKNHPKFQPILGVALTRWVVRRLSDRIICISRAVAAPLQNQQARIRKTAVIPNAVAAVETPVDLAPERLPFTIGYVGRMTESKHFHDLLGAFAMLYRQWQLPVKLRIAGTFVDDAYELRMRRMMMREQLNDAIEMRGFVNEPDEIYQGLHVLVLPSHQEAFGRALIEAMVRGLPCVAANGGGVPDIINPAWQAGTAPNGRLYPPGDVAALSNQLLRLFQLAQASPHTYRRLGDVTVTSTQRQFSPQRHAEAVEAVYHGVLDLNPQPGVVQPMATSEPVLASSGHS